VHAPCWLGCASTRKPKLVLLDDNRCDCGDNCGAGYHALWQQIGRNMPLEATFTGRTMARIATYRVGPIAFVILGLVASTAAAQTSERSWVLEKGQGVTSLKNSPASLTLNDKQLSGSTGCNSFRATLSERAEKRVAINDVALTRKLCAPPASDNERAIVQAFNKTEFIEEGADTLTFLSGSRETLLVWKPAKKAAERDGSIRAGMVPPLASQPNRQFERISEAKPVRKHRGARALKASRRHVAHKRHKRVPTAYQSRRCQCLCGWWG
jgi:heat shock protein HslJ